MPSKNVDATIKRLAAQGHSYGSIGVKVGMTRLQVKDRARRIGVKSPNARLQWSRKDIEIFEKMFASLGPSLETYTVIAKAIDKTPYAVIGKAQRMGLIKRDDLWSDADIEALSELVGTCTVDQAAKYLGRTRTAVLQKARWLRDNDIHVDMFGHKSPFIIPSTGILLAKTCIDCGKLLPAQSFDVEHGRPRLNAKCFMCKRTCNNSKVVKVRKPAKTKDIYDAVDAVAENKGKKYTGRDIEIVTDTSKSTVEVALELGRTVGGVFTMRTNLGCSPRRVKDSARSVEHWAIHFPEAAKVLRQHYIRLGVLDDGWDEAAA